MALDDSDSDATVSGGEDGNEEMDEEERRDLEAAAGA